MDPGDALPETETGGQTSTCEMFAISGEPKGAHVKLNACAGSTYRTVAPQKMGLPKTLRNCKLLIIKGEKLAMTKCSAEVQLTTGGRRYVVECSNVLTVAMGQGTPDDHTGLLGGVSVWQWV